MTFSGANTPDNDTLRATLIERDLARRHEAAARRETSILFSVLDAMTAAPDTKGALDALVATGARAIEGADAFMFLRQDAGGRIRAIAADAPALRGLKWEGAQDNTFLQTPRNIVDWHVSEWGAGLPRALCPLRGLLLAPVLGDGDSMTALAFLSHKIGTFTGEELRFAQRLARIVAQALGTARLARRNEILAEMIAGKGKPDQDEAEMLDPSFDAVNRVVGRLTQAQALVTRINNDMLRATSEEVDAAIQLALAQTGEFAGSDRTYVFCTTAEGQMSNTHEWTAPGIPPMIDMLQDLPIEMMDPWRPALDADRELYIPDVEALPEDDPLKPILSEQEIKSLLVAPLRHDGRLLGFVGYDAVTTSRTFLPGEVFLIRSVANVIAAMLARRETEAEIARASAALRAERDRIRATLDAMPDLVVELDRGGRLRGAHASVPSPLAQAITAALDHPLEHAFSPHAADTLRGAMCAVNDAGRTEGCVISAGEGDARCWYQISAAARDGQEPGYVIVLRDISEARQQQHEIDRLDQIVRRTTNLVFMTDAAGRISYVNPAFEARSGWPLAEAKGRNPLRLLIAPGTDRHVLRRVLADLRAGRPARAEVLNRGRHGREYWADMDIQPLLDEDGRRSGFMAVQVDVTSHRAQEARLATTATEAVAARQRLVSAVEALQDGFAIFDADDGLVLCNERYRRCFTSARDILVPGTKFMSILRRELDAGAIASARGRETAFIADWMARRSLPYLEAELEMADGRWIRVFERATPEGGRVSLRQDITVLKNAERRALEERAAAMDSSRDGIVITDAAGCFVYANPSQRQMFALGSDTDIRGVQWPDIYAPETAAWLRDTALPALATSGAWRGEIIGRRHDGQQIEQEVSVARNPDGGLVWIAHDITARRRNEAERTRMREQLQLAQRREVIGHLAAGLAHDFNNFLAVIAGSATMLEARFTTSDPSHADAVRISGAAARAGELVARLRDLGGRSAQRAETDLRAPMEEVAQLLGAGLPRQHKLSLRLPDTPQLAWADPTDVLQVVLNLAINSRDALGADENEISLTLGPVDPDMPAPTPDLGEVVPGRRYLTITVSDTGPGIDDATRARIFEPYFTTKGDGGTGLGMAIIAGIVRDNDAALVLDTAPGKGTRTTIFWPVEPVQEQAPHHPRAGKRGARLDGAMVLVVDDDPAVCEVLSAIVEAAGAMAVSTTNPQEALQSLTEGPDDWHVLVTDHDMPGLSGGALVRKAKALRTTLPCILVSALPERAGAERALFDAILAKPVQASDLVAAISDALERRRSAPVHQGGDPG